MKRLKVLLAGLAAAATLGIAPAHAAIVGTIPGGGSNDFINTFLGGGEIEGWYDANLYLSGGAVIAVEYFGAEAGYVNTFNFDGHIFTHNGGTTFDNNGPATLGAEDAIGFVNAGPQLAGLLNFLFTVNSGNPGPVNGSNPNDLTTSLANFFVAFDSNYAFDTTANGITASSGQSVFLFLDDGGADNDDNHDDMVLRISVRQGTISIPEPGTLAVLGLGLAALGALRRRRQD